MIISHLAFEGRILALTQGVQRRMVLVAKIFHIFETKVVAMSDLVHNVEAIHDLCKLLTASGNLFWNMSEARETANCSFTGITHIPEKISR